MLMACAPKPGDPRKHHTIAPEFVPYYQMYEDWYNVVIYDIPINFDNISEEYAGICQQWSNGYAEILISSPYWQYASEREKISLVFHELGHCHQHRAHTNTYLGDSCPVSLMDPYTVSQWCLDEHWDYYIDELRPD
jgi:hypothetical protein